MKKLFLIIAILVAVSMSSVGWTKHLHSEKHYQDLWCAERSGQVEVRMPDGTRCDCLTKCYAVEHDFAVKWAEAVGQSLYYSTMTGKKAGIVLIMENPEKDQKYLNRLRKLIEYHCLDITIWTMKPNIEPGLK